MSGVPKGFSKLALRACERSPECPDLKALEGSGGQGGLTIDPAQNQNQGGDHDHG